MLLAGLQGSDQNAHGFHVQISEGVTALGRQVGRLRHAVLFHADDEELKHLDVGLLPHHVREDVVVDVGILIAVGLDESHQGEKGNDSLVLVVELQRAEESWDDLPGVVL